MYSTGLTSPVVQGSVHHTATKAAIPSPYSAQDARRIYRHQSASASTSLETIPQCRKDSPNRNHLSSLSARAGSGYKSLSSVSTKNLVADSIYRQRARELIYLVHSCWAVSNPVSAVPRHCVSNQFVE
jgi:hypothetical protein